MGLSSQSLLGALALPCVPGPLALGSAPSLTELPAWELSTLAVSVLVCWPRAHRGRCGAWRMPGWFASPASLALPVSHAAQLWMSRAGCKGSGDSAVRGKEQAPGLGTAARARSKGC